MTEQPDPARAERHYQGKYRYLADFTKQQPTSNLRVRYQDSFSKRSNSHERRSPSHSANRRSSLKKQHEGSNRHYSPSCSTFNPRRQTTQQEFSPYDQRAEKAEDCLNKQLLEQNAQLRSDLMKSMQLVEGLRNQLAKRDVQVAKLKETGEADLRYFQQVVTEMTDEIQIVLTKNKMLENQLLTVKRQLQEEYIRHEEMLMFEEERRRHEQLRRRDQEARKRQERRFDDHRRPTPPHFSKRSVGKLLNRPNVHDSLGTSKIKIEEEDTSYSGIENCKPAQARGGNVDKQSKKCQELINSIKSMQSKITGEQSSSLRQLWKWLKGMGHSHSCLKKWKAKVVQNNSSNSEKWRQLVRQACGYIQ